MVYIPKYDYILSYQKKGSVRSSICLQFLLAILIEVQILLHSLDSFGISHLEYEEYELRLPKVPSPQVWQYVWLTSLIPCLFGLLAMRKDRVWLIRIYYFGSIFIGLGTCLFTMSINANHFYEYTQTHVTNHLYNGIPVILIWYFYLCLLVQVHIYGIFNSGQLISIWSNDLNKSKKLKVY